MFDMHYAMEIGVIVQGKMHRYYQNWETQLEPGDVWLCGMWEPHGFRILEAPCCAMAWVFWPPALAAMNLKELPAFDWIAPFLVPPEFRPQSSPATRERIFSAAKRAMSAVDQGGRFAQVRYRLLLMDILLLLREEWERPPEGIASHGNSFSRIDRALQMVFENRRNISVQEAAKACGMCRNTFGKIFSDLMGMGFPQFALQYRLHGVAQELRQTAIPLKAVAQRWGFTDTSHLHRRFVEQYGCSPKQYRKKRRLNEE
jgi:AraC-like DNA-binding protein